MDDKKDNSISWGNIDSNLKESNPKTAKESNPKTSEQKTLEAIRSNTSTIVNIMVFYLVLFLIYIIYMLVQMS